MKSRRDFLKDVCPTVAFAFFGASFLEACASDDDVGTGNSDNGGNTGSGTKYTVDLGNSSYNALNAVGGWVNAQSAGIPALLLRISDTKINAYTNVCPHQGVNNRWSLVGGNSFKCAQHGNSYSTDCPSSLTCYTTSQEGNILTITIP
jgi:hypothetical protein